MTGLRFFAALAVVALHIGDRVLGGRFQDATFIGFVGVTFFFVLSGFVLTWSYRPGSSGQFYRRRFARVWPLHAVTWALAIVFLALAGQGVDPVGDAAALLLVHAWGGADIAFAANGPSWSLSDEAFFYALFPLLIVIVGRVRARLALALLAAAVAAYVVVFVGLCVAGNGGFTLLYLNPLGRLVDFLLGITIALAVKHGRRAPLSLPAALTVTVGAYGAVVVWCAVNGVPDWLLPLYTADAIFLPVAVLLIWAAASDDGTRAGRFLEHPVMVRLGVWSFALYLTHAVLLQAVELAADPHEWPIAGRVPGALLILAACIALSGVAYRFVEAPMERRISGRTSRLDPETTAPAEAGAVASS